MDTGIYDGAKTQFIGEQIWGLRDNDDNEEEITPWREDEIAKMDETKLFKEKLDERMKARGFSADISNQADALAFLKECCDKAGVSILPQTLKNWVNSGKYSVDNRSRSNFYKLCFALKMNLDETKAFFHKALLTRPFNYKDLYESVCCFCLNTNRLYKDVERLVQQIQSIPSPKTDTVWRNTALIGSCIERCRTEDELVEYWMQNSAGFTHHRETATEEVKALLNRCYTAATSYYAEGSWTCSNPDELLGAMFGFNARAVKDGKNLYAKAISESDFPPAIRRNFPQREQIKNILNNKASDDVLRKALIAFSFFEYYALEDEPDFEEFEEILNSRLEKCGYIRTYWRNPYDWIFGHCATQIEPLCSLQELVEDFVVKPADKRRSAPH